MSIKFHYEKVGGKAHCIVYPTFNRKELEDWCDDNSIRHEHITENGIGMPHLSLTSFAARGKPTSAAQFKRDIKAWKKSQRVKDETPSVDEQLAEAQALADSRPPPSEQQEVIHAEPKKEVKVLPKNTIEVAMVLDNGTMKLELRVGDNAIRLDKDGAAGLAQLLTLNAEALPAPKGAKGK